MGGLTAMPVVDWPVGSNETAAEAVSHLARDARDLVATATVDTVSARHAASLVAAIPHGASLVADLAALAPAPEGTPLPPPPDPVGCAERFLATLGAISTAVYVCRRVHHPGNDCLFGDDGGYLCRRVLAAAHALGDRAVF